MAFDGRKHTKTQAKEHHAEPEMKCLLFQLGMGKKDQKVWTKKSFSTKKEKQQKKNVQFSKYKILHLLLSKPCSLLIAIQLFNENF